MARLGVRGSVLGERVERAASQREQDGRDSSLDTRPIAVLGTNTAQSSAR